MAPLFPRLRTERSEGLDGPTGTELQTLMRGNKTEREKAAEQTSADLDEPQNEFVWSFSGSSLSLDSTNGVALRGKS